MFKIIIVNSQQEIEIERIEKENQEYLHQKKMYELTNTRAESEAKRLEMEERRNEDLLQSYLKAKKRRVSFVLFEIQF